MGNESDFLLLNWGVWYVEDDAMANNVDNLTSLLKTGWPPKPFSKIFWRSSIVFQEGCQHRIQPSRQNVSDTTGFGYIGENWWHQREILTQERSIVWPAIRTIGARILH